MTDIDTTRLARLAFTARSMAPFVDVPHVVMPGFTPTQWMRLRTLAESVDARTLARAFSIHVALAVGFGVFATFSALLLAVRVFPAAVTPGLRLALLFTAIIGLIVGGIEVSRRIAIRLAVTATLRANLAVEQGDAELAAKVKAVIGWMSAALFGFLLLVAFLYGYFGIPARGGPIMTALDWLFWPMLLVMTALGAPLLIRLFRWPPVSRS